MKSAILEVLNNETLTTAEERVEAITSALGPLVVPKDVFNETNNKLNTEKSNYTALSTQFDEFKKSKMTDDEKREAEQKEFNERVKNLSLKESEYAVRDLFSNANIPKDKYEKILGKVVSESKNQSVEIAQTFIEMLGETIDETKKQTTTQLLNNTPKPIGGVESSSTVSKLDDLNNQLTKAIENKNSALQTQLMTEIFNEQNKQVKI